MKNILREGCVLLLFIGVLNTAFAENENPQSEFTRAITAFQAGDFNTASKAFESARQLGLDTPALNYNLGVTYYKLKQYDNARLAFERTAQANRWQALAYYNIGLIAYRQENNKKAQEYARKVLKLHVDDKVRTLALVLLQRASAPEATSYWVGEVGAGLGYDSNVSLINSQSSFGTSNKSDFFLDSSASIGKNLVGGIYDGLNIYGSVYRTDYLKENEFDLTSLAGGLSKGFRAGNWNLDLGGNWEFLDLDGQGFYRTGEFIVVGMIGNQKHNGLNLGYRLKRFDETDPDFEYLRGWQTAITVASAFIVSEFETSYGYDLQVDQREDLEENGERFSFSPTTHSLFANVRKRFGHGWQASLNLDLGSAQYSTEDIRAGQAPEKRRDTYYEAILQGVHELTNSWRVLAEIHHINNQSNLDEFDYTRNIITVSADWRF